MLSARAYGKINLTLEITGRRPDGYHTLETVMQSVSVADMVSVEKDPAGPVVRCGGGIPEDPSNTAWRAVEAFAAYCKEEAYRRVCVRIEKHIPSQAGMGGGSADAAAVLVLLNELFQTNLPVPALCAIGAGVGADVPFCIAGGTQLCRGIGEILSPAPPLARCLILLCKPPQGVSTGEAFRRADEGAYAGGEATRAMVQALAAGDLAAVAAGLQNDFERLVPLQEVQDIRRAMLEHGALGARMTGSGSVVYGLFSSPDAAVAAAQALQGAGQVYLAGPVGCGVELCP